jgi:hypothetical protein
MMNKFSFYCLFILLVAGNVAFGQKSVMMGKVFDANGKPVAGAELKITGRQVYYKVKTDNDGIYNTPLIDPQGYHVMIDADGKYFTTERVKVVKPCQEPEFYNFVLTGDHVELRTNHGNNDSAMLARLAKTEDDLWKAAEASAKKK